MSFIIEEHCQQYTTVVFNRFGIYLDWRDEDDVTKTLPPIISNCKVERLRHQRILWVGKSKSSSKCTCNHKSNDSRACKLDPT